MVSFVMTVHTVTHIKLGKATARWVLTRKHQISTLTIMILHILLTDENNLHGTLPNEVTGLFSLEVLALSSNRLHGSIPTSMDNLVSLTSFGAAENTLSGRLPESLFNIAQLEWLLLIDCGDLSGTLPDTLGVSGATRLRGMSIDSNRLTGTIPETVAQLSRLAIFSLGDNLLRGSIPAMQSPSLTFFFLQDNNLDGEIPSVIGELPSLQIISLGGNDLRGPIPLFTRSTSLERVLLNENSLTGNLEQFLNPLLSSALLETIDVSGNQLPDLFHLSLATSRG